MSIDLEKYRDVAERWEHSVNPVAAAAACLIVQLCAEVARLRMTDAERWAVERAAVWMMTLAQDRKEIQSAAYLADDAATLRGFLERHAKGGET